MCNQDIRQKAKAASVHLWQIADALSICDMTLTRRMRRELSCTDKARIFAVIESLAAERSRKEV